MKTNVLNVRDHLEHAKLIFDGLEKYGMCPLLKDEIKKFNLINKSILSKHDKKKEKGNRKDIYINRKSK